MPTDYLDIDVKLNASFKFQVNLRNSTVPFLQPRPLWPTSEELGGHNRTSYWARYMLTKYLLAVAMSVLVLSALTCLGHEDHAGTEPEALSDGQRDLRTTLVVVAQLALCTKLCLTASWFGQLTASGLDFEGYDTCLTAGLLWFPQAFSRILNRTYDPVDVALNSHSCPSWATRLTRSRIRCWQWPLRVWWAKILGGGALNLWALHLGVLPK